LEPFSCVRSKPLYSLLQHHTLHHINWSEEDYLASIL